MYGIKNCDSCKIALKWLAAEGIDCWLAAIDRYILINKRGTTYRQLDEARKAVLAGESPEELLLAMPTLMKRPIFDLGGSYLVGFTEREKAALKQHAA